MNRKSILLFGVLLAAGISSISWGQPSIEVVAAALVTRTDSGLTGATVDDGLRKIQSQYTDHIRPMLKQHCGNCHWGSDAEADLNLQGFKTLDQLLNGRAKWKKVATRVAAREMPPQDETPLSNANHKSVLDWIDNLLNCVDCSNINPGRVTIRRLNRTEYKNTIRDLVGVDYGPADDFPGDDEGYGFDNIADVISLPPILMEKYLQAAEDIISQVIVDPSIPRFNQLITGDQFKGGRGSKAYGRNHALFTSGTVHSQIDVPVAGKYKFVVHAFGDQAGDQPV